MDRKSKFYLTSVFALFVMMLSFSPLSEAKNEIANFTGTLVITTSGGDITLLESGESMPKINDGSMLEIFDGQMTVSTGSSNNVMASCLEHIADLSNGASVTIQCGETEGSITVNLGPVNMTDPNGTKTPLVVGETYPITLEDLPLAPATAQGQGQGNPVGNPPNPSSRAIEVTNNLDLPVSPFE
jgi:hypothetical protein